MICMVKSNAMTKRGFSVLTTRIAGQPIYQASVIFIFGALLSVMDKASNAAGVSTSSANSAWVLMTSCILFYALISSILSLRAGNIRYWRDAILAFLGLAILSALLATIVSGQTIDEAGSFRWLFVVLAIGFLVFLAIVRLMKKIVDIAIRQDDKLRGE